MIQDHLFGCDINCPSESVLSYYPRVIGHQELVEDNFFNLDGQLGKKCRRYHNESTFR